MQKLIKFFFGHPYWCLILVLGIILQVTALVYQYVLDYPPCVLCIQVRVALLALILIALLGLLISRWHWLNAIAHILAGITAVKLFEFSWQLLGTERGFIMDSCGFDPGLPEWLALDQWLPWVFEVQASCGYTPKLLYGITMAEALLAMSLTLLIVSTMLAYRNLRKSIN